MTSQAPSLAPVLIAGVTSAIGRSLAELWAKRGHPLILTARQTSDASPIAADLSIRFGVPTATVAYDAETVGLADSAKWQHSFQQAYAEVFVQTSAPNQLHGIIVAFGLFGRTIDVDKAPTLHDRMQRINANAVDELLVKLIQNVPSNGFVAIISSVAGDRPRPSLQSYAESKQNLNALIKRLRNDNPQGPTITVIKPGPVETPMTWGVLPPGKGASPAQIASDSMRAIDARKTALYTPTKWRYIMFILQLVPGPIYRRLPI